MYVVQIIIFRKVFFTDMNIIHYIQRYLWKEWRGERGVTSDKEGLIIDTQRPAIDQWVMNGYAFLNNKFNVKFKKILDEMYDMPGTNDLYWEQVYAEHVGELEL